MLYSDVTRSVDISRRLYGAISRSDEACTPRGRHGLRSHSMAALAAIITTRCAARLHTPHPATAMAMAVMPLMSDDRKVMVESCAKRNSRTMMVFCMTQRAFNGSSR